MTQDARREQRLLVMDDDLRIARLISVVATAEGFDVRIASSATEFFDAVERWSPSHIAVDLLMPEMDGVEVLRLLAERGSPAQIMVMSGLGNRVLDAARRTGTERGLSIIGVLPKPFSVNLLREMLRDGGAVVAEPLADSSPEEMDNLASREALLDALDQDQFRVMFQPKVDPAGVVIGFESLLRWHHPSAGILTPARFLAEVEHHGLTSTTTHRVMDLSLAFARAIDIRPHEAIAVNVSPSSMDDVSLADELAERCVAAAFAPERVIIELIETGTVADATAALDIVTRLRVKGFNVSIDDFGTGYSSMSQLVRLPFSELKVDRSFVASALQSEESRTVIRSTIDLAHNLGIIAVAEGVADAPTVDWLLEVGCDAFQGYYVAPPMNEGQLTAWRESWHGWPHR